MKKQSISLPTKMKSGREDQTGGLRLPGMMRESTVRQLKTNLGKVSQSEHRPAGKVKSGGLSQNTAPQKHQMGFFDTSKYGFGGPGSTMPV